MQTSIDLELGLGTTNVNIWQEHGRVAEDIGVAADHLLQLDGGGTEVKIDDNVVAAADDDNYAPDHLEQLEEEELRWGWYYTTMKGKIRKHCQTLRQPVKLLLSCQLSKGDRQRFPQLQDQQQLICTDAQKNNQTWTWHT